MAHVVGTSCEFCAIAAGERPAEIVGSGQDWLAFFPLSPATRGHTLVIPRIHVADLWELDGPMAETLMHACIRMGRAIRSAVKPDGMNLITSSGEAAEQSVFHLHLHLVPRWQDDIIGPIWPSDAEETPAWVHETATKVRRTYQAG